MRNEFDPRGINEGGVVWEVHSQCCIYVFICVTVIVVVGLEKEECAC